MVHNEIHAIDLGIIAAYLIAMVVIGVVVVKKVQSTDDYYLGGRSFGPLVLMATVCATIIGGSGLMGRAGVAYSSGFKAIMTALPYLLQDRQGDPGLPHRLYHDGYRGLSGDGHRHHHQHAGQ